MLRLVQTFAIYCNKMRGNAANIKSSKQSNNTLHLALAHLGLGQSDICTHLEQSDTSASAVRDISAGQTGDSASQLQVDCQIKVCTVLPVGMLTCKCTWSSALHQHMQPEAIQGKRAADRGTAACAVLVAVKHAYALQVRMHDVAHAQCSRTGVQVQLAHPVNAQDSLPCWPGFIQDLPTCEICMEAILALHSPG